MSNSIRVMVERGKKKRVVASAFDWPGWDRSAKVEEDALRVLAAYRPRYAPIADLAGQADEFAATGDLVVVERLEGTGMTDFYGLSARSAGPEYEQMSEAACERRIALGLGGASAGSAGRRTRSGQDRAARERCRDPRVRPQGRCEGGAGDPGRPGRASSVPRRLLRGDPRPQQPGRSGTVLDGPVHDPAMRLPHARPLVGDGGPGPL